MNTRQTLKKAKFASTLPVQQRQTVDGSAEELPWFVRVVASRDETARDALVRIDLDDLAIGRAVDDENLCLDDPTLSRRHAVIRLTADGLEIVDEGSANGVFVNGDKIAQATVHAGDTVRLGDTVLLVCCRSRHEERADNMGLIGRSPVIATVRKHVRKIAPSGLSVVVTGPTGTGKEVVARALHEQSGRSGQFIAVNCPALPGTLVESTLFGHRKGAFTHATSDQPGAFVQADDGTLFLDEIGDMPVQLQPKLLRALESGEITPVGAAQGRKVDARVVVATNVDLSAAMQDGRFRQDLYARLAGVRIELPPLSQRRDDIALLLHNFLPKQLRDVPLSANFAERLMLWSWPRNVRELRKLAERLAVLHPDADQWLEEMLDSEMLAPLAAVQGSETAVVAAKKIKKPSRQALLALLAEFDGNVSNLARHVGRSRKQVYRWMAEHGLQRGTGR